MGFGPKNWINELFGGFPRVPPSGHGFMRAGLRVKKKKKIIDSGRKTLIKDASTSCMHFYDLIIGHFVGKIKSRSRSF